MRLRICRDPWSNPRGLRAGDIPLEARILAVTDAYEAMTSTRPYREGLPDSVARAELLRHRGTQFDATVVDALLRVLSDDSVAARTEALIST